jgi:hypothetical protein
MLLHPYGSKRRVRETTAYTAQEIAVAYWVDHEQVKKPRFAQVNGKRYAVFLLSNVQRITGTIEGRRVFHTEVLGKKSALLVAELDETVAARGMVVMVNKKWEPRQLVKAIPFTTLPLGFDVGEPICNLRQGGHINHRPI